MSYARLDERTRKAAERCLTRKQLDVFRLAANGVGSARIGLMLDISETTARRTRDRALQLVRIELEKEETAA